jgi:hypothetical protein
MKKKLLKWSMRGKNSDNFWVVITCRSWLDCQHFRESYAFLLFKVSDKYNLKSDAQNGFREKKSTHTAIQTFIKDVQNLYIKNDSPWAYF